MSKFIPLLSDSQCGNTEVLYVRVSADVDDLVNNAESRCMSALGLLQLLAAGDYRATSVSVDLSGIASLVSDALSLYQMAFDRIGRD